MASTVVSVCTSTVYVQGVYNVEHTVYVMLYIIHTGLYIIHSTAHK